MTMKHTELTIDLQEKASLYAAGALTEMERQEFVRHLDEDQCSVCRSEVNELQSAISLLAFAIPSEGPSASVKSRLLEQARMAAPAPARPFAVEQPARFRWFQWVSAAVAVASIIVAVVVSRDNRSLRQQSAELTSQIAQLEVQLTRERSNIAVLTSTGNRVVDLAGQGTNVQASARVVVDAQQRRWKVYIHDLPPVPSDKSYQMWFVPKTGAPIPSEVFNTMADGTYVFEVTVPDDAIGLSAAAVTTEPAGGGTRPTGAFALLGAL